MIRTPTIIEAMDDAKLFQPWFSKRWLRSDSWSAWRIFLKALYGLPLSPEELEIFTRHTGRSSCPATPFHKAWLICGRRSGKSRVAAFISTYNAVFRDYPTLQRGEIGVLPILAADKAQAGVIFNYVSSFFRDIPMLARLVAAQSKDSIELSTGIRLEVHASDYRSVRGYTVIGACYDELAFWATDEQAASPDVEVLSAMEKGSANIPNALHLGVSSPYARVGALFEAHDKNFGKDTDELVWVGATREMNPTISQRIIDRAYAKDPQAAAAEYGAQFRGDLANFLTVEAIAACVMPSCLELTPRPSETYYGFCDPSGGASDAMTLAIAHAEHDIGVLDLMRERRPPFTPSSVVSDFCAELKRWRISTVTGDYYGAEWVREEFEKHGVRYVRSENPKSAIYLSFLPAVNSRQVRLLDNARLKVQLAGLVRRTRSGGKDSVDHRTGGHDDLANVAAGVLVLVAQGCGRLGVLEYFSSGAAERELLSVVKPSSTFAVPATTPNTNACECGSRLVSRIPGGQMRCSQCGAQWWEPGSEPRRTAINRKNLGDFR